MNFKNIGQGLIINKISLYNNEFELFNSAQLQLNINNDLKGIWNLKSQNANKRIYSNKIGIQLLLIRRGSNKSRNNYSTIFI